MRLCIFTTDLGTIASRKERLRRRVIELTGADTFDDVCFVGCRQTKPIDDGLTAYQPYVYDSAKMRTANAIFRLADASGFVPSAIAGIGVSLSASMIVEALVACDPDAVLLDVRWGTQLKRILKI